MSYVVIRKLLETQLNALSAGVPTAWENVPYKPVPGTAWQEATLLPAQTENPTLGDGFKREVGIFQVKLHYPTNVGPQQAAARAEALVQGFKRGSSFIDANVRVVVDQHPFVSQALADGAWFSVPVSIPFIGDVVP